MTSTISPTEHSTAIRPWPLVALDPHVQITSGEGPSLFRFGPNGTPYFKVQQLGMSVKYLRRQDTPYLALNAPEVTKGSVVFAKRGAAIQLNKIRILAEPAYMDTNIMALTPVGDFTTEYLFYALTFFGLWSVADITSVPQINNKHIKPLCLPLPSKDEQRAITNALSDVDSLIATLERLIAKKETIKQGMMQQLLTGETRLPGFTRKWKPRRLADLLSYEQPGPFLVRTNTQLENGSIPVLTAGKTFLLGYTNDSDGIYREHPVIIFDDFTTASQYVEFNFKVKSSAMKILSARSGARLRFIYERMQLIKFPLRDHKRYWISEYSGQTIDVPEPKEQDAIAEVLEDCTNEIRSLQLRLARAKFIKQGMMQELLTGRTRLPVAEMVPV